MQRSARRIGALAVAVGALGACGGTSHSSDALTRHVIAAADMTAKTTARMTDVVESEVHGRPLTIRTETVADFRTGDYQSTSSGVGATSSVEIRVIDGTTYSKSTGSSPIPGSRADRPWVRIRSGRKATVPDPSGSIHALRAVTDVQRLGTEKLRGVLTTRYRLRLNPDKQRAMAKAIPTLTLEKVHPSIQIWLDHAGRMRRMVVSGDDHGARFSIVSEVYDFGAPVTIEPPPADQILDLGA
jgi:hypothetical protein